MKRIVLVSLVFFALAGLVSARQSTAQGTATPYPTYTRYPTYTPYPTYTLYPTYTKPSRPTATAGIPISYATPTSRPSATRRPGRGTPTVTPTPRPLAPEGSGTRDNPVPFGTVVHLEGATEDNDPIVYEIAITQVERGDEAWRRIKAANMFNDPAEEGKEYVLVYVELKYIDGPQQQPVKFNYGTFRAVTNGQVSTNLPLVVAPDPRYDFSLFPGSAAKGWFVQVVYPDDPDPLLVMGMAYDGTGGIYFSLTPAAEQ